MEITERQSKILQAIVNEFMKTAVPVGSMNIVTNYELKVSPATVRNEMVSLSDLGYLSKSHISSGRVPTDLGLRLFVQQLMVEEAIGDLEQVNLSLEVFRKRFEEDQMMKRILEYISSETGYAALGMLGDTIRHYGMSLLTQFEELRDIDVISAVLYLVENNSKIKKIFQRSTTDDVCVIIGEESGVSRMENCAFVFSGFRYVGNKSGYIGVLGPRRMRYSRVIPIIRGVKRAIENSVKGW